MDTELLSLTATILDPLHLLLSVVTEPLNLTVNSLDPLLLPLSLVTEHLHQTAVITYPLLLLLSLLATMEVLDPSLSCTNTNHVMKLLGDGAVGCALLCEERPTMAAVKIETFMAGNRELER